MPLTPVDYRKTAWTHRRGVRADQPAAADVVEGTFYFVTDELVTERSTSTVWESVTDGVVGPDGVLATSLSIGTDPATVGALRFANNVQIRWRNGANTFNAGTQIFVDTGDTLQITAGGNAMILDGAFIQVSCQLNLNSVPIRFHEQAAPSAPPADFAHLWIQDNGAGKTQLMVEFATGGPIQIAIQP